MKKGVTITIRERGDDVMAFLNGDERLWAAGRNEYEAVGNCVLTHASTLGIEIKTDPK